MSTFIDRRRPSLQPLGGCLHGRIGPERTGAHRGCSTKDEWDVFERLATVPTEQEFRPLAERKCPVAAEK